MKVLLDTCTFLWIVLDAPELGAAARACFAEPANEVFLSVVSAWEISVKHSLGRLPLPDPPSTFVPFERKRHGIEALPLDEDAALHVGRLPALHRDPFDRMLVCQAVTHGMVVLTPDPDVQQYGIRTLW